LDSVSDSSLYVESDQNMLAHPEKWTRG